MKRRLIWPWPGSTAERRIPERPYRDSALVNAALAVMVVGIAALTGGGIVWALIVAGVFFVLATAWSWVVWRRRLQRSASGEPW